MLIKKTIQSLFEEQVEQFPDHCAALCGKQSLSYDELNRKANQLAHYLQNLGVQPDTPVALCLERSFDFLIAIMAILKSGGAYLPIDSAQPENRVSFLLNDSQAPILITRSALQDKFAAYQGKLILLEEDEKIFNQQPDTNLNASSSSEHLAYIIYTSGSTGTPKGVLIEHRSVINYCQWFAQYTECQAQQKMDFSSNPIFDMAISISLVPLMLGLTVVICTDEVKKDTQNYLHYLADSHINTIKLTPSYFKILLQEAQNNFLALPHLQSIILGGENLTASECKAWLTLYPDHILYNEYGPTETTVAICVHKICENNLIELETNVPIGKTGNQMGFVLLDDNQNPVAEGEAGELFIRGICLARGYLNQTELTQQQFIHASFTMDQNTRWYKTGDLCRTQAHGVLEYLGRIDDQVKIRGFRVEPGEIEKHLASHAAIKTVAIVAQKNAAQEQSLVAYYILKSDTESQINSNQLRDFLQHHVPDYMLPTAFIEIDHLPLTANGKLDKSALPLPRLTASQHYVKPQTPLEKQLASIWSEELGVKLIGVNDNFFELGGHSLSAARLVSKINHQLEKSITLYEFYQTACIAKLIPVIQGNQKIEQEKIKLHETEYKEATRIPLSDFQFLLWMAHLFEPKVKKLNLVSRKRMHGTLNKAALEFALDCVMKKHEVLSYRIFKFQPKQQVRKNLAFRLEEKNIALQSEQEQEYHLTNSMAELINFYHWPKNSPLLAVRLFHLSNNSSELQICIPHSIADDASIEILLTDLSTFYLLGNKTQQLEEPNTDTYYKKHVFTDQHALETTLDNNVLFWEEYLQDTSLFPFPEQYIVEDMHAAKLPYSTYTVLPQKAINNLKSFCERNHISINNGICAALALALRKYHDGSSSESPYALMNIIKSTRDNPIYDHSVGPFLRVEPIKIDLDQESLTELSRQIRQSTIETSNYQQCSNLVKLTSVSALRPLKKSIKSLLMHLITPIYARVLRLPSMYRKILQDRGARLIEFKKNRHFLINVNVRSNFVSGFNKKSHLFGIKTKQIKNYEEELLAINYVFEACFFYDDNHKKHYFVISANLKPELRESIAQELIRIMECAGSEKKSTYAAKNYQLV